MFDRLVLGLAALLLSAGAGFGAEVTGKWTFHVKFFMHNGDPWFEFQQDGEKLTGTYHGHFGEEPLTGTVKGDQLEFSITDKRGTASYKGTLSGNSVKGVAKYPFPLGNGHFEGKRSQ